MASPRRGNSLAADSLDSTVQALEAATNSDLIVLSGGVSVGTYDFVPRALAQFGATAIFHGVNQKPGKPILFARRAKQMIFGLPGNPLSCHFGFHRYVAAAIRKISGRNGQAEEFRGKLAGRIETKGGRVNFLPGRATAAPDSSTGWRVELLAGASSADIFQSCRANCYVELPAGSRVYEAGEIVLFTCMNG